MLKNNILNYHNTSCPCGAINLGGSLISFPSLLGDPSLRSHPINHLGLYSLLSWATFLYLLTPTLLGLPCPVPLVLQPLVSLGLFQEFPPFLSILCDSPPYFDHHHSGLHQNTSCPSSATLGGFLSHPRVSSMNFYLWWPSSFFWLPTLFGPLSKCILFHASGAWTLGGSWPPFLFILGNPSLFSDLHHS